MDIPMTVLVLAATGITAGFASGLLGIGGGFLMTPVQYWLYAGAGIDETIATRIAFATSLAVIIPTMVSSTAGHNRRGAVDWKAATPLAVGAVAGGLLGGTLATSLPGVILRTFFALVVIAMALRMVWHVRSCRECKRRGSRVSFLAVGLFIGIVSGLAGIGGGILLVPILVIALGFPIHTAVGTSSACLVFSSGAAVVAYIVNGLSVAGLPAFSLGYINLLAWAVLVVLTVPLSRVGVRFSHACRPDLLSHVLAFVLVFIGLLMLIR
ncbi:MAG: sulfite exporter TauE/SafE family protein [Methanolinea sp.]|nr:sulfite exporter TauE/SafE family protein [Methanolinea sp.]